MDGNSVGAGQRTSQPVNFIHNIFRNRGRSMGYQGPENPLVVQALPYGHRNLLAQLYILSLGGPVHGSIGYGQCVHAGLAEKFNRLQGIGISGTL